MITMLEGRPQTAEDMVYTILQKRILHGELSPGERVDLDRIANELDVSRTPVRTALRQLESEGLVTIRPHRASFVSSLSGQELREMYAVRVSLETTAARESVPNLVDRDVAQLRDIQRRMSVVRDSADPVVFADEDREFHLTLYRGVHNAFLLQLIDDLRKVSLRFLAACISAGRLASSVVEHDEIVDAASARDAERVAALVQRNLESTGRALTDVLNLQEGGESDGRSTNGQRTDRPGHGQGARATRSWTLAGLAQSNLA